MSMNFKEITVHSHRHDVESRMGVQATCGCGGEAFGVFQILGQSHPHLQCVACGSSYCLGGQCEPEDDDDPATPDR